MQEILSSTSPITSLGRHQNASTPVNDDQSRLKLPVIKNEIGKYQWDEFSGVEMKGDLNFGFFAFKDPSSSMTFNQYSYPAGGYEQTNFSVDSLTKTDNGELVKSQQNWKNTGSSLLMKTTSPVSSTSSTAYENLAKKGVYPSDKEQQLNDALGYAYNYANQFQRSTNLTQSSPLVAALTSSTLVSTSANHSYLNSIEGTVQVNSNANFNCPSTLKYGSSNFYNSMAPGADLMAQSNIFANSHSYATDATMGGNFMNNGPSTLSNSNAFTNEYSYDMKQSSSGALRNLSPSNAANKHESTTSAMYPSSSSSSVLSSSSSSFTSSPSSLLNNKNSSSPSDSSGLMAKLNATNLRSHTDNSPPTTASNAKFATATKPEQSSSSLPGWLTQNKSLTNGTYISRIFIFFPS